MSGIHGILRFDGAPVSVRDLERQGAALAHRGPDGRKTWHRRGIGMGHLLMRITAEDLGDAQLLHDAAADVTLVADLRLDNREELATALGIAEAAGADMPDSALLLAAYLRWGSDCVDHLLGDFAFAIWDGRAGQLHLGRDHMGQRHIFFHHGKDFFAFASQSAGLWALPDIPMVPIYERIGRRMIFDFSGEDRNTSEGIASVPGGTLVTVAASGERTARRYWTPHADPAHLDRDEDYYIDAYRRVLSEAVACRLRRSLRPAALSLGGGFDSGAIAGLAGPVVAGQGRKLIAISSVLPAASPDRPGNARRWVEMIARHMPHLDVHYVTREGLDIFKGMTARFQHSGFVHGAHRYTNEEILRVATSAGARIIMDGFGGDYTLNPRAPGWLLRILLRGEFRRFVREFRACRQHQGCSAFRVLRREIVPYLLPASIMARVKRWRSGLPINAPGAPVSREFLRRIRNTGGRPPLTGAINRWGDMRLLRLKALRWQHTGAAMGGSLHAAAHGMELTQPYHDKRVVELSLAIPEWVQARDGRTRHLARTVLKDIYPPEFQRRGTENDDLVPDVNEMIERVRPRILSEIDRMTREDRMTRYFDFDRMRKVLAAPHRHSKPAVGFALRAFLHACGIEWFERDNRPPPA